MARIRRLKLFNLGSVNIVDYAKRFTKEMIQLNESNTNPQVSVDGLGTYDLESLKSMTARNIEELYDQIATGSDARNWRNVKHLLDSGVIQAKVDAIVAAHDDLQALRRKGGTNSRGIEKE